MRIGNYGVVRELARTASVVEYEAQHVFLPRHATVKVGPAMFREACVVEMLRHPGVPRVFESGRLPDGMPWFAIEPIEGVTLAERRGPLPIDEATPLVRDLAAIVTRAHARGVIHGSLEPGRIVLCEHGPVVVDWSTARRRDAAPCESTIADPFVAPEGPTGEPADVYALGAIAYLIVTGTIYDDTPPAAEARPDAPNELTSLIDRMLSPAPSLRPAAAEVHADLDWLASVLAAAPTSVVRISHPRWARGSIDLGTRVPLVGTPSAGSLAAARPPTRSDEDSSRT